MAQGAVGHAFHGRRVILVELILLGSLLDDMEHALAEELGIEPAPQTEFANWVECGPPTLMFSGVQRPVTACTFRQRLQTAKSLCIHR
jgi:hypothetical protein